MYRWMAFLKTARKKLTSSFVMHMGGWMRKALRGKKTEEKKEFRGEHA